jgi:hypothetical protein
MGESFFLVLEEITTGLGRCVAFESRIRAGQFVLSAEWRGADGKDHGEGISIWFRRGEQLACRDLRDFRAGLDRRLAEVPAV